MARAQAERESAVASIRESLEFLTSVMRARLVDYTDPDGAVDFEKLKAAPAALVRRYQRSITTTEEGRVIERTTLELESALAATVKLIEHHRSAASAPEALGAGVFLEAFRALPDEALGRLLEAMRAARARDAIAPRPRLDP
jgi:hypothetical protein